MLYRLNRQVWTWFPIRWTANGAVWKDR